MKQAALVPDYPNIIRHVLNAADYGVPQKRERFFIVGFRGDLEIEWSFPEATHSHDALLWSQWRSGEYWDIHKVESKECVSTGQEKMSAMHLRLPPTTSAWRTVRDALVGLPDPEIHPCQAKKFATHEFIPGARSYKGHTGSPYDSAAKTLKAGVHGVPGGEGNYGGHNTYFFASFS